MSVAVQIILIILVSLSLLVSIIAMAMISSKSKNQSVEAEQLKSELVSAMSNELAAQNSSLRSELAVQTQNSIMTMGEMLSTNQQSFSQNQNDKMTQLENRIKTFSLENEQKLENIRQSVEKRLEYLQSDNNRRLEEMRSTVDEKLQKTLEEKMNQSFSLVNERLEQVYKGLGEMQNLAVGVGDLKKVLSNVKTRGIVGEIQLGAILSEILSPEQYDENIATKKGSKNVVEYAIKLPAEDDGFIYLPIDSKFPGDTYAALRDAVDEGDKAKIDAAAKTLLTTIKNEAKDIRDKYIDPPNTTEFAIMFLPFEGLYSARCKTLRSE